MRPTRRSGRPALGANSRSRHPRNTASRARDGPGPLRLSGSDLGLLDRRRGVRPDARNPGEGPAGMPWEEDAGIRGMCRGSSPLGNGGGVATPRVGTWRLWGRGTAQRSGLELCPGGSRGTRTEVVAAGTGGRGKGLCGVLAPKPAGRSGARGPSGVPRV